MILQGYSAQGICRLLVCTALFLLCVYSANAAAQTTQEYTFQSAGGSYHIHFNGDFTADEQSKLQQWLRFIADASATAYGRAALDTTHLELQRRRHHSGPVPFAQVIRGEDTRIRFYVDPTHSLDDFINDWTAYHEFSHLMLPYPGPEGIWFSEGLASYYQNVLRARAGVLTPLQAWDGLYRGFLRGNKNSRMQHLNLQQLSPLMWETGSFMRVYWSGALYFLKVDIALRQQQQSLDQILLAFQQSCLKEQREWTTDELVTKLDQLSASKVFSSEMKTTLASTSLVDFSAPLHAVGLDFNGDTVQAQNTGSTLYLQMMQREEPVPLR